MTCAAAIGEDVRVGGYALAGVRVFSAQDAGAVRAAFAQLPADVACLILTPAAHGALAPLLAERDDLVWAVMPG
jgi:vacuolar-type H+-ATPase subunit F/Vma7